MFYDVKIMNSQGKVEKIVPAHELSKSYWKKNFRLKKRIKASMQQQENRSLAG